MKRKRENDIELKPTSHGPNMTSLKSISNRLISPSVLTEAETELRAVMDDFVTVYERLDQEDNVEKKPNYSYTEMIYLAILRSPNFCLPITEIYKYIKSRFSFFRNSTRKHWCNAVRHSLSKTKCFTKITVGRGSSGNNNLNRSTYLWCIVPGSIVNFARGDYRPNVDTESGTNTLRWGYFRVNAGQFWDQVSVYLERKMEIFQQMIFSTSSPGKVLEAQACYIPDGSASTPPKHSASAELLPENIYCAKSKPTHTVHHGPNVPSNSMLSKPTVPNHTVHHTTNMASADINIKSHSPENAPGKRQNISTDSGNASLSDCSPEEKRRKHVNGGSDSGYRFNASYLSNNSSLLDETRKTPELPDLGHVSPLSISPSLSPIGNISYEADSGLGTSLSSLYPTFTSFASTPVITSHPQQRYPPHPPYYGQSVSPPMFPSFSPPSYPISSNSAPSTNFPSNPGLFYPPYIPPACPVPMTLPYLPPTTSAQMSMVPNMYKPRIVQPSAYKPFTTGNHETGAPSIVPQLPTFQYDTQQASSFTENSLFPSSTFYPSPESLNIPLPDWSNL